MMSDFFYTMIDLAVTCLEVFFLLYLMRNEVRKGGRFSLFALILIVTGVVLVITQNGIPLFTKFFIEMVMIAAVGKLLYYCGAVKGFLYGIIYVFSVYCSEIIVMQSWNIFNEPVLMDNVIYKEFVLSLVILAKAVHFLFIVVFERIMRTKKNGDKVKELGPVLAIGISFLIVLQEISLNIANIGDDKNVLFSIGSSAIILGTFIYIILFNDHYLEVSQTVQREEVALYELQLKYDYYQKKRADEELIKEIYHDMKHHILLADGTIRKEVLDKLAHYDYYYDAGNEFLNVIIADKLAKAAENGIRLECNINFNGCDFIVPIDISTIFGNILDNSMEACRFMPEEDRIIFLNVLTRGGILYIVLKNRMVENSLRISEKISTNKNNKAMHGFGISNVKKAVKNYDGECKITAENSEFIISIVIPVPAENKLVK